MFARARLLWIFALAAGCAPPSSSGTAPHAETGASALRGHVVYARARQPWLAPPSLPGGSIGRGEAALHLAPLPVTAEQALEPLRAPAIWQLPSGGDEPALAVVAGSDSAGSAVELLDIDAGTVRWRVREPAGPVVGVTATAIVGADRGTWALDAEGVLLWHTGSAFAAMADSLVVVAGSMDLVSVVEAASGRELWRTQLPDKLLASDARWACAGGELLLLDDRGGLHRLLTEGAAAGQGRIGWTVDGEFSSVEGCQGPVIAATQPGPDGSYELWRIERKSGEVKAKLAAVRGHWLDDDGALVVAGDGGVRRYAPGGGERLLSPAPLGARVARLGGRALLQSSTGLAILEEDGRVQRLAARGDSAALGHRAVLTGSWAASPVHTVKRAALPDPAAKGWGGWGRVARPTRPALPPAPLVDPSVLRAAATPAPRPLPLPAPAEPGLAAAVGTGVLAVLRAPAGPLLVRYELDGSAQWSSPQGCRGQRLVALVAAGDRALCLGSGEAGEGVVVASDAATGEPRWEKTLVADELELAGEVALVRGADRATLLRASDGAELASWRSDDGGRVRAALIEAGGATLLVGEEAGAVVARWPLAAMLPLWSAPVAGDVVEVQPAGDAALVALAGGAAYLLRGRDGASAALGGEAEQWRACGDGIVGISPLVGGGGAEGSAAVAGPAATKSAGAPAPAEAAPAALTRVALYARDGALRWAYDLALPGALEVMTSEAAGASALSYGDARDHALPFDARGLGEPIVLPESAVNAIWVRPLTSGVARWAGISTTSPRGWAF